jgi:DNA-binding transcriptional regulator YiaG
VRGAIEGVVLAVENALSRALGLSVGDPIGPEHKDRLQCIEVPELTVADVQEHMAHLKMSPDEFADSYGITRGSLTAFLEGRGELVFLPVGGGENDIRQVA